MSGLLEELGPRARLAARTFVAGLELSAGVPPRRPRVVVAMIGSADGRATVEGRAGGLGSPADRAVLRELRAASDAVLVGAGTLLAERYATVLDPDQRARRAAHGLPADPIVATISRGLDPHLAQVPLFGERRMRLQVYTEADGPVPTRGAQVAVRRFAPGALTARACLEHLRAELGVRVLACEGGPTLLRELIAQELVDDLVLTVAPMLVAGAGRSVLHGPALEPPVRMRLGDVLREGDHLFLRYVAQR